jgi:hypothetical protein
MKVCKYEHDKTEEYLTTVKISKHTYVRKQGQMIVQPYCVHIRWAVKKIDYKMLIFIKNMTVSCVWVSEKS